jgi:hypothetical protein
MSIIESFDTPFVDPVIFELGTALEAEFEVTKAFAASFSSAFDFSATAEIAQALDSDFGGEFEFEANLFLNNEPNILLDADFAAAFGFEADSQLTGEWLALFFGGFDLDAEPEIRDADRSDCSFIVDVFPSAATQERRIRARLTVDGHVCPMESFVYSEPANRLSVQLDVALANVDDRSRITETAAVTFEIGTWDGSDWVWATLLETGRVNSTGYTLARERDSFRFVGIPAANSRLLETPVRDLVVYDSARQTLSADDFEVLRDSEGGEYPTELVPIANLKLFDLLDLIFVDRLGFLDVKTNIPNFPISQAEFALGVSYMQTINGILGMFSPDIKEVGETVWVRDTTTQFPAGFPDPVEVELTDLRELEVDATFERLDAIRIAYSLTTRQYDYTTTREEVNVVEVGEFGDPDHQTTTTTTTYREFRRFAQPFVVLDEEIVSIHVVTELDVAPFTIFESTETFKYDPQGNPKERIRETERYLPELSNDGIRTMLTDSWTIEEWKYRPHPFEAGRKYLREHSVREQALIAIDSENQQLGEDYQRSLSEVYRAGNLTEEQTVVFGPVRSFLEERRPLRDGRVRIQTTETDELARVVTRNDTRTTTGDISENGLVKEQREMLVLADPLAVRTTQRVEGLNCGELPVTSAIALARRILQNRRTRPRSVRGATLGIDLSLEPGLQVAVKARGGELLGVFAIEGRTMTGSRNAFGMELVCRQTG